MSCAMHSPCISQSPQNNILEKIAAKTRQRIAKERQEISDSELEQQAYEIAQKELAQEGAFTFPFEKALAKSGVSFICEVKKASPSKGIIAQEFDYLEIARSYEKAGADAISCLTEPYYFLGSNEYLKGIAKTVSIPLLRKDFTVDARMIYEAKVLGASAVLLICALLNDEELECFLTLSHSLGLSALVEAHDASEIKRALIAGARIIGVNNRNLVNFEVDTKNSMRLRKYAGNNVLFVSESGIKTRSDVAQLETLGVDALRSRCDLPLIKAFQLKTNANASSSVCTSDTSDAATIKKVLSDAYASSADMILIDSSAGSGTPFRWSALANFNRPYFLAGGITPETIPEAFAQLHPWGIDMSSGLETDGLKDDAKIAAAVLAIKDSQQIPSTKGEPLMTNGRFGIHGGQYIPETLMNAIIELDEAYTRLKDDPAFKAELQQLLNDYAGRPSRLYFAQRMTKDLGGAKIYLKREDLNHTGAHKINNVLGQALLAKKMGKTRLIAETGAGQHGVATATAAALLDMECMVYMSREDTERQALNVYKMRLLGAEVRPVDSGTGTLKDAVSETFREWTSRIDDTYYCLGSCMGPHPFPTIVRDFQAVISAEIKGQMKELEGKLPDVVMACVGGGSNAIGSFYHFIQHPEVKLIGCEAAGRGVDTFETAATIATGKLGIFHGMKSYFCQDGQGQIAPVYSISAGLDYPGIGPEHAALHDAGHAEYVAITDKEAVDAFEYLSRLEGIIPAIESAHAVAYARKLAPTMSPDQSIVITLSGRGDKDCAESSWVCLLRIFLRSYRCALQHYNRHCKHGSTRKAAARYSLRCGIRNIHSRASAQYGRSKRWRYCRKRHFETLRPIRKRLRTLY